MKRVVLLLLLLTAASALMGCRPDLSQPSQEADPADSVVKAEPELSVASDDEAFELKLYEGYKLFYEEPNRHVLVNDADPGYFARIEVLGDALEIGPYKANLIESYKAIGSVEEISAADAASPWIQRSAFALAIAQEGPEGKQSDMTLVVSEIEGSYFAMTLFKPESEASKTVEDQFHHMLAALRPLSRYELTLMPGYQLERLDARTDQLFYSEDPAYRVTIEKLGGAIDLDAEKAALYEALAELGEVFIVEPAQLWHSAFKDSAYALHLVSSPDKVSTGEMTAVIKAFEGQYFLFSFYFPKEEKGMDITPKFWDMLATLDPIR